MNELTKKTVWIAPDGFETDDEQEARRYCARSHISALTEEYVSTLDFSKLTPRARLAQTSMATNRVMHFLDWAMEKERLTLSGK